MISRAVTFTIQKIIKADTEKSYNEIVGNMIGDLEEQDYCVDVQDESDIDEDKDDDIDVGLLG